MSSTAGSLLDREGQTSGQRSANWDIQRMVGIAQNLKDLAGKHNAVKLGLCLVGLWVLNLIY
jgi:hypothetical protein